MNLTNLNEYVPTPSELKLLEALSNPENRMLSITDLCKVIGISRVTYYTYFKNPDFVKLYNEYCLEMVKSSMNDIVKATIDFAKNDSRAHADRKILFEMAKMYQPKQAIDVTEKHIFFSGEEELED